MNIFKGYVRTKNKRAIDPYKGVSNLRTLEEVENLDEYAGVLSDDVVMIDIDDHKQAEKLYEIIEKENIICRVENTNHGKHFYFLNNGAECFKNCHTKVQTLCGLKVDVKTGKTNSISVLKLDGVKREVICQPFEEEQLAVAPNFLNILPVKKIGADDLELFNLEKGDGRNDALFRYCSVLLRNTELTKDEVVEVSRVINQYIFKEPLSEKEFKTVLRDERFIEFEKKDFTNSKGVLDLEKFSMYLIKNLNIIRIGAGIFSYIDNHYVRDLESIEHAMVELIPSIKKTARNEILEYIKVKLYDAVEPKKQASANLINFKNGILNLDTMELVPHNKDTIIINQIPHNYNPKAYDETMDRTLNKLTCYDSGLRTAICEMIGFTMYRRNELRKAFVLLGDRANGKSTLIKCIQNMLGENNYSSLDLKEVNERFKTASLFCKCANIGDDISDEFIPDISTFKKLVTGDKIAAEFKGKDPFEFEPYAKFIFSANTLPRVKDATGAVISRLILIPFNQVFSDKDPDYDPKIRDKLSTENAMEYLINISINALKEVLKNNKFTITKEMQLLLDSYNEMNNPLIGFLKDYQREDILNNTTNAIYEKYLSYCQSNGLSNMASMTLTKKICKLYNLKVTRTSHKYPNIYTV